ncbi:MAG: PaaI family thioesterase, partial [Alphaproteobacteria bacterium]
MLSPQQREMIEGALAAQGFFRYLGTEIVEVDAGLCTLALSRRPELLQQNGYFHGGVIAYLVDNASAAAAATCLRAGQTVLTAEYKLNFLSPARGERLVCRAAVVRAGRRMT